jgi:hypothetical protein
MLNASDQWLESNWTSGGAMPLTILTTSLPVGAPTPAVYSQALAAIGGASPYTWAIISGPTQPYA